MATSQAVLTPEAVVPEVDRVAALLESAERERSALQARVLELALRLDRALTRSGQAVATPAELGLALTCSDTRAWRLLDQARLLDDLPDGVATLADGLLTVEQVESLVRLLDPVPDRAVRLHVWERLRTRLLLEAAGGGRLTPARLTELVRTWVVRADPAAAARRRAQAEAAGRVDYRRRDDGLVDLSAFGVPAPLAQSCLQRIEAHARQLGPDDDRTADKRRLDALVGLLLGRACLPLDDDGCTAGGGCGCATGAPAPCGAQVQVLVPLGAALGTTDEVAQLVGHGPLDPQELQLLLLSRPRLRPVWVDEHGTPVAVGDRTTVPRLGDDADVRRHLLRVLRLPDGPRHPRHPDDHAQRPGPDPGGHPGPDPGGHPAGDHPPARPGAYRASRRLRRLLELRRPLCEWPGCGARASLCDTEHDVPWPAGPTCACNCGPLCRRHHRVKQTGWTKARQADGDIVWTSPSGGRTATSPSPHAPAAGPTCAPAGPEQAVELSPLEQEQERELTDPGDPRWDGGLAGPPAQSREHPATDRTGEALRRGDTAWSHDLRDPYAWLPVPEPTDP